MIENELLSRYENDHDGLENDWKQLRCVAAMKDNC